MKNKQEGDDGGMKSLEGYFDNLSVAVVNEKSVLEQLVLNNTKLAASNKSLVALVKKINWGHQEPQTRQLSPQERRASQRPGSNPLPTLQEIRLPSAIRMLRAC